MKCTIEVSMNNAAFEDDAGAELARILKQTAKIINQTVDIIHLAELGALTLRDINGNVVGTLDITE